MADGPSARLRRARERAGLSQAGLAAAAGVSRSQVSAIEQGRHVPAVDAALRIAAAVGLAVEELFGGGDASAPAPALRPVISRLADGAAVKTAHVGDVLVGAAAGPQPGAWAQADGVARSGGRLERLPGSRDDGCVLAGCDPALAGIDRLTAGRGPARVIGVAATTGQALDALAAGTAHGALVHGPPRRLPTAPVPVRRWRFARWQVGLAYPRDRGTPSLEALLSGPGPLVRRPVAAASDQAVVRAARRAAVPAPRRDAVAAGHVEAAQRAAWTGAAAVTYAPAAAALELGFLALEDHLVELWVAEPWAAHPGVEATVEVLRSASWRQRLEAHPGYDLAGAGTLVEAA